MLLLPFAASYAQKKAANAVYPNSADGLSRRLAALLTEAKVVDQMELTSSLKNEMEIPDFPAWFNKVYGKSRGRDSAEGYRMNVDYDEFRFAGLLRQLAQGDGSLAIRKINDMPEPADGAELAKLHSMKKPVDIYFASWLGPGLTPATPSSQEQPIGYFMFIDGAFRWDNAGSAKFLPVVPHVPGNSR